MATAKTPTFTVRNVQLARALFAAMAAIMITFSGEHSASVGLSVFSGFAVATGLVWACAAWLVYPSGRRGAPILLGFVNVAAGVVAGVPMARTTTMFFVLLITWAVLTVIIEGSWAWRERKGVHAAEAKDGLSIAVITLVYAAATALIQPTYALEFFNEELQEGGTLTGITIAVGIFGAYAAIIAVFLAIAGFSPKSETPTASPTEADHAPVTQEVAS